MEDIYLKSNADTLVMLTWSDWFTELRSNRYHYAKRFANWLPVLFVQPDLNECTYQFEETEIDQVTVLHLPSVYNQKQLELFNQALLERGYLRPIFWIYNPFFQHFLSSRYSVLNIYHGTEDYLSMDSRIPFKDNRLIQSFKNTIKQCHFIVSVSDGVKDSFEANTDFEGKIVTVSNGCDYKFYSPLFNNKPLVDPHTHKIVFYQGNIFDKLDFALLIQLAKQLPNWHFHFCGKVIFDEKEWQLLRKQPNVYFLGLLTPEELREKSYQSTVGIIPFINNEWLLERSLPLKTFEYLAAGLPVVSSPIKAILGYKDIIDFATSTEEFKTAILNAEKKRFDPYSTQQRLNAASLEDYDIKFETVVNLIKQKLEEQTPETSNLQVAILYEPSSLQVNTIKEHLSSFQLFSSHQIKYLPATQNLDCDIDLSIFDVIVIHYSIRLMVNEGNYTFSPHFTQAIQNYGGYKILFIQDEYEETQIARNSIKQLGIHTIYTCVPQEFHETVYPPSQLPNLEFINTITGFVPSSLKLPTKLVPTSKRTTLIGYRGRRLPFWYGSLGQEKYIIGIKVKEFCLSKNLIVDIECEDSKRIYGDDWYRFLSSARATLGTESGSKIFDYDGQIRLGILERLASNPELTYEDVYEEFVKPHETVKMNQISPKIFESILFKTALILFEGEYSHVVQPDIHYIPLKKDFSNIEEVIAKVQDDTFIDAMTERAYQDIIQSKKYTYAQFIYDFDNDLRNRVRKKEHPELIELSYFCNMDENTSSPKLSLASNVVLTMDQIQSLIDRFKEKDIQNLPEEEKVVIDTPIPLHYINISDLTFSFLTISLLKKIIPRVIKKGIQIGFNVQKKLLCFLFLTIPEKAILLPIKKVIKRFFLKSQAL